MMAKETTRQSPSGRGRKQTTDIERVQMDLKSKYNKDNKKNKNPKYLDANIKDQKVRNSIMSKRNRDNAKQRLAELTKQNEELKRQNKEVVELKEKIAETERELRLMTMKIWAEQTHVLGMPNCSSYARFYRCNTLMPQDTWETQLQQIITDINRTYAPVQNHNEINYYNNQGNERQLYKLSIQGTLTPMSSPLPPDLESIGREELIMGNINTELYHYNSYNLDSELDRYLDPVGRASSY